MASWSFTLPDLGEGTVESEIVVWHARVGDFVKADEPLVDVMTDKATIEITAPVSGALVAVAGEPGDVIAVGAELAVFATDAEQPAEQAVEPVVAGGAASPEEAQASPTGSRAGCPRSVPHAAAGSGAGDPRSEPPAAPRPQTSPALRRLARERGIDLDQVRGSGPNGRITRADVEACLETDRGRPALDERITRADIEACPDPAEPPPTPATGADPSGVRELKLVGLRRRIAEQMTLSASRIPHFTYVEEADVTELERLRQRLNETRREGQPALTYLPFFMLALVQAAREFPACNAHFDAERQVIRQFEPVHVGIAVQTGAGLSVPVIRHVETLGLWQCAEALRQVAERTKAGRARREELSGSTITITSLGTLGGIVSTPIINYPEVAIIGINRAQRRPVFADGAVANRLVMNISSSFDHRVVDGYDAASAIQALKRQLECPAALFLPDN